LKVLVVSAHPDDMEIGCAGTLRRLQAQGADIVSVVTVAPSEEVRPGRSRGIVQQELDRSYQLSGFELRVFHTMLHPNGRPNLVADNVTMTELSCLLEPCDIMILPNPEDYHQDHKHTYELALPFALKHAKQVWSMHSVPYCHSYRTAPNMYYDIGDTWAFKQSLLECYGSYFTSESIADLKIANQFWGSNSTSHMAEAFGLVRKNG